MGRGSPWGVLVALASVSVFLALSSRAQASVDVEGTLTVPAGTRGSSQGEKVPPSRLRLTLNGNEGGEFMTYSRVDGSFTFYDVDPGVYSLEVLSREHHFSLVKVKVPDGSEEGDAPEGPIQVLEFKYAGAKLTPAAYPIKLHGPLKFEYFEKKQGFSLKMLYKNPMMLIMIASMAMMFLMPKLKENLDPETLKELERVSKPGYTEGVFQQARDIYAAENAGSKKKKK